MSEMKKAATEFLALTINRRERCEQALDLILAACDGAPLYNTEYQEAKELLGRALEEMWQANVNSPFVNARMGQGAGPALSWKIGNPYNLHDVLSVYKKMGSLKATSTLEGGIPFSDVNPEMVKAIRQILDAAYPIALAVKDLKAKVVKGRKPAPRNPKTVAKEAAKRTCQCCFRAIAVDSDGNIMKHGWQEEGNRRAGQYGNAWHVGECPGTGYEPFELSCERTKWYMESIKAQITMLEKALVAANDPATRPAKLSYTKRTGGAWDERKETCWVEDDGSKLTDWVPTRNYGQPPSYLELLNGKIAELKSQIEMATSYVAELAGKIASWKKAE